MMWKNLYLVWLKQLLDLHPLFISLETAVKYHSISIHLEKQKAHSISIHLRRQKVNTGLFSKKKANTGPMCCENGTVL